MPWTGRQRSLEPVLSEIQKAYPQEAGQILHVLRRMPARCRGEGASTEQLSVVVRGLSRRILPSMVEYVETLPDRNLAVPWALGEMYAELPAQQPVPMRNPPPVSADAFRLLSRVERELRRTAPPVGGDRGPVLIAALDPLAAELRASSRALATYLGVSEVRVVDPEVAFPRSNCLVGRTRTGVHWWVRLPGETARRSRQKHRVPRTRLSRVRSRRPSEGTGTGDIDYASEAEVSKQEQIRALVQELDGVLGAPLLGPTKLAGAWTAGFHSVEDFRRGSFDRIEQLSGFGGPIAESLVLKLGGTVPPRHARPPHRSDGAGPRPPVPAESSSMSPPGRAGIPSAGPSNGGGGFNSSTGALIASSGPLPATRPVSPPPSPPRPSPPTRTPTATVNLPEPAVRDLAPSVPTASAAIVPVVFPIPPAVPPPEPPGRPLIEPVPEGGSPTHVASPSNPEPPTTTATVERSGPVD